MTWHIKRTREFLRERHGDQQLRLAQDALRASTARLDHARYHFQELKGLLKRHIDDQLPERDLYELTLFGQGAADLNEALVKVEAHMIACAQSLHSIPDALAHVVFFAAGLNLVPNRLSEREVSLGKVLRLLDQVPPFAAVAAVLRELKTAPAFEALDATVNYGKHRGLPDPVLQLEPGDRQSPYAMQFPSFHYGEKLRPEVEVEELLSPAYELMSRSVVNTGKAINEALAV